MFDNRIRILYVLKILWECTNEEYMLSATDLVKRLEQYGIECERKSVYRDLNTLSDFGFDLIKSQKGVYMASRIFEVPELKLLIDAIQSSSCITEKKSRDLVEKMRQLSGEADFDKIKSHIFIQNRIKAQNETIYYNIDLIMEAINQDCRISFSYCNWNVNGKLEQKCAGRRYLISPWFLQWASDKYYLIGYDDRMNRMKHFRVDKMQKVEMGCHRRKGYEVYKELDIARYATVHFGMFQGDEEFVTLLCERRLIGVLMDRFGKDLWFHKEDESKIRVRVKVRVSDKFFGWIASFGGEIILLEPAILKNQYRQFLLNNLETIC